MIVVEILLLAAGFAVLIKGADWFVDGCSHFATSLGVSQIVVGLTIVAMGTSMPEAAVSITAAVKNTADIAVGNVVGSNIFNILFILGTSSIIVPIPYLRSFLTDGLIALGAVFILWIYALRFKRLDRISGVIMLAVYGGYFAHLVLSGH